MDRWIDDQMNRKLDGYITGWIDDQIDTLLDGYMIRCILYS